LERLESQGQLKGADASKVSKRAKERGLEQLGTLGSGNHFLEVQKVDEIFDEAVAKQMGLSLGQVTIMLLVILVWKLYLPYEGLNLIVLIVVAALVYFAGLLLLKDENMQDLLGMALKKVKKYTKT